MIRYLLATDILSSLLQPDPPAPLMEWMAEQNDEDLYIASFTLAEIRRGLLEKAAGKRRDQLEAWFSGPDGPQALFAGRILPFEVDAALIWGRLMADGTANGRPRCGFDMIIGAVAQANGCVVVTNNPMNFPNVTIFTVPLG